MGSHRDPWGGGGQYLLVVDKDAQGRVRQHAEMVRQQPAAASSRPPVLRCCTPLFLCCGLLPAYVVARACEQDGM